MHRTPCILRIAMLAAVASIFFTLESHADWSTGPAPNYFTATCPLQSIERDGKGQHLIAYHRSGAVWLRYHNGTQYVDYEVFKELHIENDFYSADTYITSVSVAVHHDVPVPPEPYVNTATKICIAAGTGQVASNVSFVYKELTLSVGGALTAGTLREVVLDQGVGTGENAMQWFDPSSCHEQPTPANNRYYANGTHDDTFIRHSGFVRATYTDNALMFACAVRGFVSHDSMQAPTNDQSYWYEEHQALYLIEENPSTHEWDVIQNDGNNFEFETCEIFNSDAPYLGANTSFQFTADHTIADSWVLAYTNRVFEDPLLDGKQYARSVIVETTLVPSHRTPFVAVWNGTPYVIYDYWEMYYLVGPDPTPTCSEDYIMVTPLDPGAGLGVGMLGLTCIRWPGYTATGGPGAPHYTDHIKYVGVSADGQNIHIVSGNFGDTFPTAWYKLVGPKTSAFTSSDAEGRVVEYARYHFGDRVAVKTNGEGAILIEEGEEDRHHDWDYEYKIAEQP